MILQTNHIPARFQAILCPVFSFCQNPGPFFLEGNLMPLSKGIGRAAGTNGVIIGAHRILASHELASAKS